MPSAIIPTLHEALLTSSTTATELAQTAREKATEAGQTFITVAKDGSEAISDARLEAGAAHSALEGIPLAIKDVVNTAGLRTTMGSDLFTGHVPTDDALLVRQLKNAGANVIGKANTHEFSYGIRGDAGAFGVVTNPHDPARIAGGSSSGSAAAVARGIVPLAIGTDTAGSVRVPAALCGVVGFKPTYNLLSTEGVFPLSPTFDTAGFLASTVEDVAVAMDAIGTIIDTTVPLSEMAFKILEDNPILGVPDRSDEITKAVAAYLDAQCMRHSHVTDIPADFLDLYNTIRGREAFLIHRVYINSSPEQYQPATLALLQEGQRIPDTRAHQAHQVVKQIKQKYLKAFAETDILITSTVPIEAPLLDTKSDADTTALMSQCVPWNVLGWPALAIPYWEPGDPLPRSIQLIGKPGCDAHILRAGIQVQKIMATLMGGCSA